MHTAVQKHTAFVRPMLPIPVLTPPVGSQWIHEATTGGRRVQIQLQDRVACIFDASGTDITNQAPALERALLSQIGVNVIIDAEWTECDASYQPTASQPNGDSDCLWCFDVLSAQGVTTMQFPLLVRKQILADILRSADDQRFQYSAYFEHGSILLTASERLGFAGVVSKKISSHYVSGLSPAWCLTETKMSRQLTSLNLRNRPSMA